jgi:stalled ribosome alternative rescue factor ArfA
MLQMPNAAAQLVVDPLYRHGVLFFRGIREDVLGDLFSSKDLFRKHVKTEKTEKGKP